MKKYILILLVVVMGCGKDFLKEDPKGQYVGTGAISDGTTLEQLLIGAYGPIQSVFWVGQTDGGFINILGQADDICAIPKKAELAEFNTFTVSDANNRIINLWQGLYRSIQNTNGILEYALKIVAKSPAEQTKIDAVVGEAHWLRAYNYYYLVRFWGEVPLILDANYSTAMLSVSKATIPVIYNQIVEDLKVAETMMYDVKPAPGRPNKGTAKAYLADVYLTMGGWPMKDNSKYALAAEKAKELIDNQAVYGFNINTPLDEIWSGKYPNTKRQSEEVFALYQNGGDSWNAIYYAAPRPEIEGEGGWDDYLPEIYFYKHFPAGKRKDITFQTQMHVNGSYVDYSTVGTKHPAYKKFFMYNSDGSNNVNWAGAGSIIYYRYAEVLLTYAEAVGRSGATDLTDAYKAVNAIKSRAGLPPLIPGLSPNVFADSVFNERGWEMAGEFTRYFDVKRMELLEDVNSNAKKDADDYKVLGTIYKYLPIPGREKTLNPNL